MIHLEHTGGIGIHARYDILQDGHKVGYMARYGFRSGWQIKSVHYHETLANGIMDVNTAKAKVKEIEYPTAQTVYEAICKRIEKQRRAYKEKQHAQDYARLARELVAGSNTAREEIEQLVMKVEGWIIDRNDQHERGGRNQIMGWSNDVPRYPKPPGANNES